jgi:chromosome partitioning protein
MLALPAPVANDGAVSDPDDRRARVSSIFERLRSGGDPQHDHTEPVEPGLSAGGGTSPERIPSEEAAPVEGREADAAPVPGPAGAPSVASAETAEVATEPNVASAETAEVAAEVPAAVIPEPEVAAEAAAPLGKVGAIPVGPVMPPDVPVEVPLDLAAVGAEPAVGADMEAEAGPRRHPGAVAHHLPRRFAIANQKGGVGKTTTAVNLGAALAELDYRVLVVDLDPQGNATTGLGINGRNLDASIYDVILHDVPIEDVIEPTTLRNLFVVPATIDLAGAEIELVPVFSRELRLRRALETIDADFDYILIDCPPSLGLLTVNGLAAAGEVVVPIQCEYYALEGLGQLLRNVGLVQANLNRDLEVSTIILTMYDARTRLAEQVVDEVRKHFGDRVCRNVVPRTVRLSEAPSFGQPIIVFDSSSRGAIAYRELAKEVSGGAPQRVR